MLKLARNDLLLDITNRLANAVPDWDDMAVQYKQTALYKNGRALKRCDRSPYRKITLDDISKKFNRAEFIAHKYFSEMYLRRSLRVLCAEYGNRVQFYPIRSGNICEHYKFVDKDGSLVVYENTKNKTVTDIDDLLLIDNLPVLFEIKIGRNYKRSPNRKREHHIDKALTEEHIKRVTDPINAFFKEKLNIDEVGYVLVISDNQVQPEYSGEQRKFEMMGGVLVPFFTNSDNFTVYLREVMDAHKLWM